MTDIQKVILSIFKEISIICNKHDIPYYAIGGTCLGAVRHKGFIPWDDDLDIAIPIEQFERFFEIARCELPPHLYIYSSDNVKHYHYIWLKICNSRTTFIEKSEYKYKDAYKGVFVDIMPISGVPNQKKERLEFVSKIKYYEYLNEYLRFPDIFYTFQGFFGKLPFRLLSIILPYNYFTKKYINFLKEYPFKYSLYTGYVWCPGWLEKLTFPTTFLGSGVDIEFEDTLIKCPSYYHKYLTQQFGDYMIPPSVDMQSIHEGLVDLDKPFSEYKNQKLV